MGEFFKTEIMTVVLAVYGLFFTEYPYYLLCAAGILMVVFVIDSFSEQRSICILAVKASLMAVCCALSGGFLLFLLFGQLGGRRRYVMLPPLLFMVVQAARSRGAIQDDLSVLLVQMAVLVVLSDAVWRVQCFVEKYLADRSRMWGMLGELAVSELTERKLNRELMIRNSIIERNARLEERENISRNIHNNVGHTVTAAVMALDAAELLWSVDPDRAIDKVEVAKGRIQSGLDSIRHAVRVLDEEAESISIDDFRMELEAVADHFAMDSEIQVSLDFEVLNCDLMIPHEHTEFLTGAVGELLTNGVKHGRADKFTVRVQADSCHLKVTVLDNGRSDFNQENAEQRIRGGFGIKKIISYAQKNGGSTAFGNEQGFCAEIMLPTSSE